MDKWTIVLALFLINFIDLGTVKSFSVLMDKLVEQLDSDVGTIGAILGSYHGLASLLAPFITPVVGYIPVKCMAFISAVGSSSLILLSLTSSEDVFAVLALIAGVCYAFVITSMVLRMFEDVVEGFALAFGIVNSGTAAGMIVLPILSEFLLGLYGWRGTMAILGAISVHTSVLVLLVGEKPAKRKGNGQQDQICQLNEDASEVTPNEESKLLSRSVINQFKSEHRLDISADCSLVREQKRTRKWRSNCTKICTTLSSGIKTIWMYFGLSLFTDHPYTLILNLGFLVIGLVNTAWIVFLIPHGVAKGVPLSRSAFLALFGGIGQCLGRLGQGLVIDRNWLSAVELNIILSIISAMTFCLDPLFQQYEVLCALAFIGGLVLGGMVSLTTITLKQFFPSERFKEAYSLNCFFFGLGEPLGGLIAGYIADAFTFDVAYEVLGSINIALSVTLIATNYFITRTDTSEEKQRNT